MQQDAFLPYVESGLFTFIDATTENPSCEVNSALLSRARVYVLQSLTVEELQQLVDRAAAALNDGLEAGARIDIAPDAREQLAAWADGDARRLISGLHKAVRGSNPDAALYWFCRLIDGGADPKPGPSAGAHGGRGHRAGRSARHRLGHERRRHLRAARLARRRADAGA